MLGLLETRKCQPCSSLSTPSSSFEGAIACFGATSIESNFEHDLLPKHQAFSLSFEMLSLITQIWKKEFKLKGREFEVRVRQGDD